MEALLLDISRLSSLPQWLDSKFAERLEAYKHQQQRELEQLRFQINALFDRVTKLHQREFQVLPDAYAPAAFLRGRFC